MIVCVTNYEIELALVSLPELDTAVEFATLPIGEISGWLRKGFR